MRLPVLLVTALLAAGCTTMVAGTPSTPTGVLLPPRPREIRLDGVDPCSLLTAEQRVTLNLTSEPHFSASRVELFNGDVPTCTVHSSGPSSVVVGIGLVTTVGLERWLDPALQAQIRATEVAGFPALVTIPTNSDSYCGVEVDVATGQLLDVQVLNGEDIPTAAQTALCDRAVQSATAAMHTLVAR